VEGYVLEVDEQKLADFCMLAAPLPLGADYPYLCLLNNSFLIAFLPKIIYVVSRNTSIIYLCWFTLNYYLCTAENAHAASAICIIRKMSSTCSLNTSQTLPILSSF